MATYARYGGAPGSTGDTTALPSPNLWNQVDAEMAHPGMWNESYKIMGELDYLTAALPTTAGIWNGMEVFSSSGATFNMQDEDGSPRKMVEATTNEGLSISQSHVPYRLTQGDGELVFEFRFKMTAITLAYSTFIGLLEDHTPVITIPFTTGDALSDNNMVGFHIDQADPDGVNFVYKANGVTAVDIATDVHTMVADTYVKLGFVFNRYGDNILASYVNGAQSPTTYQVPSAAGTDFPNDVRMGWLTAVFNNGANAIANTVDWVRVAQRRVTSRI